MDEKTLLFLKYYETNKDAVYNYALRMLKNKDVAADVVQETFLKLFENLDSIREHEKIKIWIFTVARNEVFGIFRSKASKSANIDEAEFENKLKEDEKTIPEKFELKELSQIIEAELNKIPELSKDVFVLKEYGGLSYSEIAEITDRTVSSVKSRLFKTRKKLIKEISKIFS